MASIGVLAYQGSVAEHMKMLSRIEGVSPREIRFPEDIGAVSGVILPGGESTTMGKLIKDYGLIDALKERITKSMPVWGTCAGMILLAKEITGEDITYLNVMDIAVRRNAYGGQLDSFTADCNIPEVSSHKIPLVFIRAPWVEKTWGNVKILARIDGRIIAVQQGNILATSFHPELTEDMSFHNYFAGMVKQADMQ
ncbi:MAG: pyridoxal 5'-phosphate synthase glutaminase subunit PdxT [Bacillota bacterium]|nr:pyridoxal 5'-phosphate synthase glutaminase subunit PdxT [Bacillota bacterium]